MNGLDLLIGMTIVGSVAYVLSKISLLKQERQFWKDSCFIMAEKYNDLLVKESMQKALDKTFNDDRLKVN
tara:strand:+ start:376 stop:585 length:210 start_codon:yes stop_codon:yes gene_type:complete